MRANYKMQRLYVENSLDEGDQIEVALQSAHYLTHVLRLKDGDEILAFNGRDGEWKSRLKPEGKSGFSWCPSSRHVRNLYRAIWSIASLR